MTAANPLYDPHGKRLYLTSAERDAFLAASADAARDVRTFCNVLYYTGCRLSEALALTPQAFDYSGRLIVFETLKRRRKGVYRAVPVPYDMLDLLHSTHGLKDTIRRGKRAENDSAGLAVGAHDRLAEGQSGDDRGQYRRRSTPDAQGPSARLRDPCSQQRRTAQYGIKVDGACPDGNHGDLRERRGRGATRDRR